MRSRYFLACPSSPARRHTPAPPTPTGCSSGCPGTPCLSVAVADEIRFACLCATLVVLRQSLTVAPRNLNAYGFVVGILVCLITDIRSFSVDPTTGSIEFRTREPNDVEYIQSAWEDAARRQILLGTLANQGVFAVDDPRIAAAIENLCEPIPRTPLEAYLSAAIKCAEQPVPNALRQLARQKSPPFHTSGRVVTIGVPDTNDQPSVGRANTCQNGEWFRRRVLLTNPLNGFQVTVDATGHYGQGICGPIVGAPDIQLNEGDALSIFDGPIDKFEEAVAIIVN